MRITFCVASATCLCLFANSHLFAAHLPPVDPILDGTDHSHEDHSGHFHGNHSNFTNVNFTGASFVNGSLNNDHIFDSIFVNADLTGTYLDDGNFVRCDFRGATINTTMAEATWLDSDLRGATFWTSVSPTHLNGLYLRSNLSGQDFSGFNLSDGAFDGSDMRGVNLRGALFAYDSGGYRYEAYLNDVIWDATTIYDANTVFPAGFDPVAAGLTFVPEPGTLALAALGALGLLIAARRKR